MLYFLEGVYEYDIFAEGYTAQRSYVYGDKWVGIHVIDSRVEKDSMYYVFTDYLGSFDRITNEKGDLVEVLSFDAWGNRRDPDNWQAHDARPKPFFSRGFTGHEHLDIFKLINMNGRLYDPVVGRFFSPDPYVQAPDFTQNFNRYSYCLNNPLMYTDPSGEFPVAFAIGFVVGTYLGGSLMNQSFDIGKWDWNSSSTYVGMGVGGLFGGFGAQMAWATLTGTSSLNVSLGIGVNNTLQSAINFTVSNSGIALQSLGYSTAAGGGYLLMNNFNKEPKKPYWKNGFLQASEYDAVSYAMGLSISSGRETSYYFTDKGYLIEPSEGISPYSDKYLVNTNSSAWEYYKVKDGQVRYKWGEWAQIYYAAHIHPSNVDSFITEDDEKWVLKRGKLNLFAIGYNGTISVAGPDGIGRYVSFNLLDLKVGHKLFGLDVFTSPYVQFYGSWVGSADVRPR